MPAVLKRQFPTAEIHWVIRSDFAELIEHNNHIDQVWPFVKENGLSGWLKMIFQLRGEGFTHVYDAHRNVRSRVLTSIFFLTSFFQPFQFARRSKYRFKRFLLFRLRKNLFAKPFRSQLSFLEPLRKWSDDIAVPLEPQLLFSKDAEESVRKILPSQPFIAIAPSAAWTMKRWPVGHWIELVRTSSYFFVILGGPDDDFAQTIANVAPERCLNLCGKLRLIESCAVLKFADHVISADTGILHAADALGRPTLALIGPTAFGYPSHANSKVLEASLSCQPCSKDGRGRCSQDVYQKCMVDITPELVMEQL